MLLSQEEYREERREGNLPALSQELSILADDGCPHHGETVSERLEKYVDSIRWKAACRKVMGAACFAGVCLILGWASAMPF